MAKLREAVSAFRKKAAEAARNALAAPTLAHRTSYKAQERLWLEVALCDEKRLATAKRRRNRRLQV
jgi:hypothetical protein